MIYVLQYVHHMPLDQIFAASYMGPDCRYNI